MVSRGWTLPQYFYHLGTTPLGPSLQHTTCDLTGAALSRHTRGTAKRKEKARGAHLHRIQTIADLSKRTEQMLRPHFLLQVTTVK